MKVLFTCTYSSGISGVWTRVHSLAQELIKRDHEVHVFSSNLESGTQKQVSDYEIVDGIKCHRFKVKLSVGSKNAYIYNKQELQSKLKEIMPQVVDCQTYRHYEGTIIAKECFKLRIPCFLTTHAPFVDKKVRGFKLNLLANLYDLFIGRAVLKKFKKIIAITKWEYPYLNNLGIKYENIVYVPNGIPQEFVNTKIVKKTKAKKIIFFGRIAPVKDVETLISAFSLIKNKPIKLEIVGPAEQDYLKKLQSTIEKENIQGISFKQAVYKIKEKIKTYQSAEIFVLPSKREGMPQSLIESMACGPVSLTSDIEACKELVEEGKTGFLFKQGSPQDLASKLDYIVDNFKSLQNVRKQAKLFSSQFNWPALAEELEKLYLAQFNKS